MKLLESVTESLVVISSDLASPIFSRAIIYTAPARYWLFESLL